MALYKSNGFAIGGNVFPTGTKLTEENFPSEDHIKLCLGNGNIDLVDDNVDDADFDEYEDMKVDELKELLIESGKTEDDFKGLRKPELIELLRNDEE